VSLNRDIVMKLCNSFKLKIETVITADGDFINPTLAFIGWWRPDSL
jgi:hypothetical protein